ncbi:MAG: 16S rRNA (guanine(527)-N(7))-methyltransferase RsmG [Rhizobiaceae bacterium]|nr:16S rRNA (guanine(527)-N(7))-methyltransferase RsmG [Rhizobiaceae bacterium]
MQAVAGPVSRETFERVVAFQNAFLKWAARINLAAPSTLPDIWVRHILDSAQLVPLAGDAKHFIDLGSGGGFPGAVLALLYADRPETRVDLIESNGKKAAFLRTVLGSLDVRANVHANRIEDLHAILPQPDVVTARALAPLGSLFRLAAPWLQAGGRGLFHKGRDFEREIKETTDAWRADLVQHPSAIEPGAVILEVKGLKRVSRGTMH